MGTLASELGPHADRLTGEPRIHADANVPTGVVRFMRQRLGWRTCWPSSRTTSVGVRPTPSITRSRDGSTVR